MSKLVAITVLVAALLLALFTPLVVFADVVAYLIDTSGSMRHHGFEEAKQTLIRRIEIAQPGDVLIIGTFDVSDRVLGRLAIGEDGSPDAKADMIASVSALAAKGQWTNLDLAVKAGKAALLEERTPGPRRIVMLSDGLSDPAPGFKKMDIQKIASIVPQSLGFSLYLISLPDDLSGLFQVPVEGSDVVSLPEIPHIKGVPLQEFSKAEFEKALDVVKEDPSGAIDFPPASPLGKTDKEFAPPFALVWLLVGTGLVVSLGACVFVISRNIGGKLSNFAMEISEGEEKRDVTLGLRPGVKKTFGSRGDIHLQNGTLPPVVFTLSMDKHRLWLTPQDSIAINGRPITVKTAVNPADLISVRDLAKIVIHEKEEQS